MNAYASRRPAPIPLQGPLTTLTSLVLFLLGLLIVVPAYGGWFSGSTEDLYRFGLPILWIVLAVVAVRDARLAPFRILLLSLFGVSLGLALAHIVDGAPLAWFGLSATTPQGGAVAKILAEVIPVCGAVLLTAALARLDLQSLTLVGGRVGRSLGLGLLMTIPLFLLFVFDPSGGGQTVLAMPPSTLLAWFPWIAVFSLGNGFLEEFWFRGFWLTTFGRVIGPSAALHVTSFVFCLMHVIVYWQDPMTVLILTPVWLYMGYVFALITRRTGSLWGPVLGHAIADVLFMYTYFARV